MTLRQQLCEQGAVRMRAFDSDWCDSDWCDRSLRSAREALELIETYSSGIVNKSPIVK